MDQFRPIQIGRDDWTVVISFLQPNPARMLKKVNIKSSYRFMLVDKHGRLYLFNQGNQFSAVYDDNQVVSSASALQDDLCADLDGNVFEVTQDHGYRAYGSNQEIKLFPTVSQAKNTLKASFRPTLLFWTSTNTAMFRFSRNHVYGWSRPENANAQLAVMPIKLTDIELHCQVGDSVWFCSPDKRGARIERFDFATANITSFMILGVPIKHIAWDGYDQVIVSGGKNCWFSIDIDTLEKRKLFINLKAVSIAIDKWRRLLYVAALSDLFCFEI